MFYGVFSSNNSNFLKHASDLHVTESAELFLFKPTNTWLLLGLLFPYSLRVTNRAVLGLRHLLVYICFLLF